MADVAPSRATFDSDFRGRVAVPLGLPLGNVATREDSLATRIVRPRVDGRVGPDVG
jgi:hypothetical protein